jgi:hypothetical protein
MPASVPTTIINNFGTVTGWSQLKAVLYGRTLVGISKISYKDSIERASMPSGTRIHEIPPTDISVLTLRNGKVTKDVIRNFQFTGQGREVSQGDKAIWLEMPCYCTHIDYNVT